MQKNKSVWIIVGIVVVVVILFMIPGWTDPNRDVISKWHEAGLECLPGHQNASLHIHQQLLITVDGKAETIPANTGIVSTCMAETHTHDIDNVIHVESVTAGKKITLGQFLVVYGKPIERPGYNLVMKVNDKVSTELGNLVLEDHQKIELIYTIVK